MGGFLSELNNFGPLTASGLVLAAVWLIFRGNLVPRIYYDEMRASRDKLQATLEMRDETIRELVSQQRELIDGNLTTRRLIEALSESLEEIPPPNLGG